MGSPASRNLNIPQARVQAQASRPNFVGAPGIGFAAGSLHFSQRMGKAFKERSSWQSRELSGH
jgi:hypothetical protein